MRYSKKKKMITTGDEEQQDVVFEVKVWGEKVEGDGQNVGLKSENFRSSKKYINFLKLLKLYVKI